MKHTSFTAAALLSAALILSSCSADPDTTGAALLPDSLLITRVTNPATSDTNYLARMGGNLTDLLVGKTAGLESRSIMEFNFPALDSTARIDSGLLVLRLKYFMPRSGGALELGLHRMLTDWSDAAFRWDSVPGSYDPTPAGVYSASVTAADTLVRIPVDTALLRAWFTAGKGSVMLVPSASSTVITGFHSHLMLTQGLQPVMEISYRGAADTTVVMRRNAVRGVFVSDAAPPAPPAGTAVLQAGVSYRSRVLFDSLVLPPGAAVATAILELTADTVAIPSGAAVRDTLSLAFVQDRAFPIDSLALSVICPPVIEGGRKIYRADIRTYVQLWTTREPHLGILVRTLGDLTTVDRIAIFSSSAPDTLRPRIRLTYTQFP